MTVDRVTPADYATILAEHEAFWGERDLRAAHHPVLAHEFADTSIALRDGDELVGYLFGFVVPETGTGYVHLVGVRRDRRRRGLATRLWAEFAALAWARGATELKAITTPTNDMSIGFHSSLGMTVERVADYAGPGHDRIVFRRTLEPGGVALDHVLVAAPVGAGEAIERFYGTLLGLAQIAKPAAIERPGAWFALGGAQLHVLEYEDFAPAPRAHPALRYSVAGLAAVAERLDGAGHALRWDDRLAHRRRFYTDDPWGNRLELVADLRG